MLILENLCVLEHAIVLHVSDTVSIVIYIAQFYAASLLRCMASILQERIFVSFAKIQQRI